MVWDGVLFLFDEMKLVLDLCLKLGIYCFVIVLEECGFICCLLYCVCVLEIVCLFDSFSKGIGFQLWVIDGSLFDRFVFMLCGVMEILVLVVDLLVMGCIVVGVLIEVILEVLYYIVVLGLMLLGQECYYVLEVWGDFMIEVGINDGDVVVICEQDIVENGDIVVVLVEGLEVMLKCFCCKGGMIVLEVVNFVYEICVLFEDKVCV